MAYFKYIPYLFLIVALVFVGMSIKTYSEGGDGFPNLILAVSAIGYFFVRRYFHKQRYNNPKQ